MIIPWKEKMTRVINNFLFYTDYCLIVNYLYASVKLTCLSNFAEAESTS